MSEYVELSQLQKFCREYTATDAVRLILAERTDLLHAISGVLIPEGATNGDVIKALFKVEGYTPIRMGGYTNSKQGFHVLIEGEKNGADNFHLSVSKDWLNASYEKVEAEKTKGEHKKMKIERAMEILNNVVNFVSVGNDTGDTINELLKYGFEAEELVNDFNFSKIDVEDVTGEKIEEEEERE